MAKNTIHGQKGLTMFKLDDLLLYATGVVLWSTLIYYVVIEPYTY
jgi:hypothetical protein